MSTTIGAVIINLLSMLLPYFGIIVADDAVTTTVQTLIAVITGIWIWYQRQAKGDVTALGFRK